LGADPEYSDIREKLEQVVKEGFMVKIGTSGFKFVHDKVREAAYSLISEKDKDQVSGAVERLQNKFRDAYHFTS
jgi:predicted ATPase